MTSIEQLRYWTKNRVATIQLNRPDRKNALTLEMLEAWARALRQAHADDEVRAVVVTGAGDAFCSARTWPSSMKSSRPRWRANRCSPAACTK